MDPSETGAPPSESYSAMTRVNLVPPCGNPQCHCEVQPRKIDVDDNDFLSHAPKSMRHSCLVGVPCAALQGGASLSLGPLGRVSRLEDPETEHD